MGTHGIITGFDDENNTPNASLPHASGHEYDWLSPLLGKWRASRGEGPWTGPTVEHKSVIPLVFSPEDFMRAHIWEPLGIAEDTSFYPKTKEGMKDRMADISTLNDKGEPLAVDAADFDILLGSTGCLGGASVFATPKAYGIVLSAVARRYAKLLKPASFNELFRPQLNKQQKKALNDYVDQSPIHTQLLAIRIPPSIMKTWCFAGLVAKEGQEGHFGPGTVF
ncbi:beta-lactamase/transpeptidase-like protein [Nemania abortiva]|nr:beta-lactamase/transpeptidase-like protein [Nemania abortiva]